MSQTKTARRPGFEIASKVTRRNDPTPLSSKTLPRDIRCPTPPPARQQSAVPDHTNLDYSPTERKQPPENFKVSRLSQAPLSWQADNPERKRVHDTSSRKQPPENFKVSRPSQASPSWQADNPERKRVHDTSLGLSHRRPKAPEQRNNLPKEDATARPTQANTLRTAGDRRAGSPVQKRGRPSIPLA